MRLQTNYMILNVYDRLQLVPEGRSLTFLDPLPASLEVTHSLREVKA